MNQHRIGAMLVMDGARLTGIFTERDALTRVIAGNLDPKTGERVFTTLIELARATNLAALIATHNMDFAARLDRRITLENGVAVELA